MLGTPDQAISYMPHSHRYTIPVICTIWFSGSSIHVDITYGVLYLLESSVCVLQSDFVSEQ